MTWTVPAMAAEGTADPGRHVALAVGDYRARHDGLRDRRDRDDRRERYERDEEGVANQALTLASCNVIEVAHLRTSCCAALPRTAAPYSCSAPDRGYAKSTSYGDNSRAR